MVADLTDESLSHAVLVQLLDIPSLRSYLALRSPSRLNSSVAFANNQSVMCPAVCTTHRLCHSNIMYICAMYSEMVYKMPVFRLGMHPGCLGRWKTILVISRSAHFLRSRRPLLLHLPSPSDTIPPSQVWWPVSTLALKSPRRRAYLYWLLQELFCLSHLSPHLGWSW